MSDVKLGQLITEEVKRDAIHIALTPVRANEKLRPGQHVGLKPGSELFVGNFTPYIGIVDPFLTKPVKKDDIFYLCLYQNTVTGMRHHWIHPSFKEEDVSIKPLLTVKSDIDIAKEGLASIAQMAGVSYDKLYSALIDYAKYDQYTYNGDNEDYSNVSIYNKMKMWEYFTLISGIENTDTDNGYYAMPFSCSC